MMDVHFDPDIRFFQLVELLERLHPDAAPIGSTEAPDAEAVRFRSNPTFAFPASEVASVTPNPTRAEVLDVRLNLFGLYGPASPMPTMLTERVLDPETGSVIADFLDLFNHRLASLLYRVWKHYRPDLRYREGAADPLSHAVGSLFGVLPRAEAPGDPERVLLLPYAGLLAMASRSAQSAARILAHCLDLPCRVEEFVLRRVDLPSEARFTLGSPLMLGVDTLIGDSVEDVMGQCRIWIGPMTFQRFTAMLPDGAEHSRVEHLIETVIREPLARDLGLVLAADEAPDWMLGDRKLGWSTWADAPAGGPAAVRI